MLSGLELTAMGRKKLTPEERAERKLVAVAIKGTDAWKQWVERGAKHAGMSVSTLVDQSLRAYLKKAGFTDTPPER